MWVNLGQGRICSWLIPGPSTSIEQPVQKVIRRVLNDFVATEDGATAIVTNASWLDGRSQHQKRSGQSLQNGSTPEVELKEYSLTDQARIPHDRQQARQATIRHAKDGRLSFTAYDYNGRPPSDPPIARDETITRAILVDDTGSQSKTSSMRDVARRLLAAFEREGCSENKTMAGNSVDVEAIRDKVPQMDISSIQIRQELKAPVVPEIEFYIQDLVLPFGLP